MLFEEDLFIFFSSWPTMFKIKRGLYMNLPARKNSDGQRTTDLQLTKNAVGFILEKFNEL